MLAEWTADLRHAWRALLRTPGFLITCVVTLSLAIGATAGMFSVVNTVIIKPLPFPESDELVLIQGTAPGSDLPERFNPGLDFFVHYKENSRLIDGMFVFGGGTSTLRTEDRVERIPMAWPSWETWNTLGVRPLLGRLPNEDEPSNTVTLISYQLWQNWFGRDSAVVGKTYFISGAMRQIIGVMPESFRFPNDNTLLWNHEPVRSEQVQPGQGGGPIVARLKPGVTREQLAAELTQLSKGLPERFGGSPNYARIVSQHSALVDPLLDRLVEDSSTSLWVLLAGAAIVLIIACANVANLFMVRAEGRHRDLAVRRAIGATRTQLVRLQMAEAFLVAMVSGVIAIALAMVMLPAFKRAAPEGIPRLAQVGLDLTTIGASFLLVLVAALACGVIPALRASSPDLRRLREGGRGTTAKVRWARNALVVGQTSLALVLLIGSALLIRSFSKLRNVDAGYDTENLYTFQFAPEQERLRDGPSWGQLHLEFMDRLRALPGVQLVGVVNNLPLDEGTGGGRWLTDGMSEEGGGTLLDQNFTGGDYFQAMGIDLMAGRIFTPEEAITPNTNVILSRSAAEKLWPGQSAVGKQLRRRLADTLRTFTVVGVVADVKQDDWREAGEAVVYFPLTGPTAAMWGMGSPAYVIKSPRADQLQREVREQVRQVAPEAPVYREYTMAFLAQRSMVQLSFTMLTLGVVSGLALILGAVGLYGVLAYIVAERTREIGVRMALGASTGAVRKMVVTQGVKVVLVGVVIGIAAALLATRTLRSLLFEVQAVDPIVFAAMSVMMIAIGMLASYLPARRASAVDPIESLRSD